MILPIVRRVDPPARSVRIADGCCVAARRSTRVLLGSKLDRLARKLRCLLGLRDSPSATPRSLVAAAGSVDLTTPRSQAMLSMRGRLAAPKAA